MFLRLQLLFALFAFSHCISIETVINFTGLLIPPTLFPEECKLTAGMIDASAKFPSGLKAGNLVELGAFDLCLKPNREKTPDEPKRKYCLMKVSVKQDANNTFDEVSSQFYSYFKEYFSSDGPESRGLVGSPPNTNETAITLGWCLPACFNTSIINNYTQPIGISVEPALDGLLCQTEDDINKKLTDSDWGVVGFLIAILCVIILSTIYDMYLHFAKKRAAHLLLIAFSAKTNSEKLLAISNNPDQLGSVHGIRFISMMWIVLGHRYFISIVQPIINLRDVEDWALKDARHMFIINAPVSVDTFFVLSGLLLGYGFCLARDKGVRFNIPLFYIHRYLRLTPVLGVVVLVHATIISYFGSGPYWPLAIFTLKTFCEKHWWAPLVYVQNYYNTDEMCVGQTWYLSVDFQLFILSPIILLPLWKWPKPTLIASGLLVIGSIISSFVVSYYFELPPFSLDNEKSQEYMDYYYIATHVRFGPWLMGLMLGYYLFKLKKEKGTRLEYHLHPVEVTFGWVMSLAIMLACLFSSHHLLMKKDYLSNSFWNALHRHAWSLGLCWVIFACTQGYGGIINSLLSWSPFQVLGRFTYTIYLVHLSTQYLLVASGRTSQYFSDFNVMYNFWGDFVLSLAIGVCLTLAFESPMITVEKILFSFGNKRPDKQPILPIHRQNISEDEQASTSRLERHDSKSGVVNRAFESD